MPNYAGVELTWDDHNDFEGGFRVYRATAPFTIDSLPPVLATLPPNTTSYFDRDIVPGFNYHYRVSTFFEEIEVFATALVTANTKIFPDVIGEYFQGGYYIGNIKIPAGYIEEGTYAIIMAPIEGEPASPMQWKTSQTDTPNTNSTLSGLANTLAMAELNIDLHPAAKYCLNFEREGFDDFYLPSSGELNLAWVNRASLAALAMRAEYYWSSSQAGASSARIQLFANGDTHTASKNDGGCRVRPVRRLKLMV